MNAVSMIRVSVLVALSSGLCMPAAAQEQPVNPGLAQQEEPEAPAEPRPIRPEDYGQWESLGGGFFGGAGTLSPDGRWIAYQVNRVNDEDELRVRMLATEETKVYEYGGSAAFSDDSKWLAFSVGVADDEAERLRERNQPVHNKLTLLNLANGEEQTIEHVASFNFSDDGQYLIMRRYGDEGEGAADIVLRDLDKGVDTNFGNVANYSFNDVGTLLAMVIDAKENAGNGIQLYDPTTSILRTIESHDADYSNLTWREDAADLAMLREMEHEDDEDEAFTVIAWTALDTDGPTKHIYAFESDEHFPAEMRITDFAGLRWDDDGEALFFGVAPWEKRPKSMTEGESDEDEEEPAEEEGEEEDSEEEEPESPDGDKPTTLRDTIEEPSNVEVWHAKDIDIIPLQKRTESRDRRENYLAAYWLADETFVQLGNELTEEVNLFDGQEQAIGLDNTPYEEEKRFGPTVHDLYLIDTHSGGARKILDRVKYEFGSDPTGRYFLYVRDNQIWSFGTQSDAQMNLTGDMDTPFINQEVSSLTDEKPPYGIGAWTKDGSHVLLYDRYDMYLFTPDGSNVRRLTTGAADAVRHRMTVANRDDEDSEYLHLDQPMLVSLYGDTTKKSGYGKLTITDGGGRLERLIWRDSDVGGLGRADDAEVYTLVEEKYDDSPDIFLTDSSLANPKQITELNPQQEKYLWGHAELIDYENVHGEPLQGALYYPAGYEEGTQYPMIVYIYELRSQVLHSYSVPSETSAYNPAVFSAEGYFVFQPDIVYRPQNPGLSAVECVVPAVEKVLETGMIDRDRIGLVGHSWGAYQTAFIVTQTDLFAAGVAGAPLTNMMSMSMSIYWNSGQTDAWIFHESQGRMDQPFWQDVDTYIKNSPIFNIDNLNTPLMIAFGTEDGAVDYNQGVEMYNAARLAGKQFIMLVYPGENHGLRQEENQVDYHYRILEWFGHYLKDDEPKPWITEGLPWLERQKQIEEMEENRGGGGARGGRGGRGG